MALRPAISAPSRCAATAKSASAPRARPVEVYIANFPWGKYIAGHGGADVCVSSWQRLAPNTLPSLAKAGANYMNSQLIQMEAVINGYQEGIAWT
jgi:branched-chain amino acid aminotransferase